MTLLYVVLSIVPIVQVESRVAFALKISPVIAIANVVGRRSSSASGVARLHSLTRDKETRRVQDETRSSKSMRLSPKESS